METAIPAEIKKRLLEAQQAEITEYHIYQGLSGVTRHPDNRDILTRISRDELRHYHIWKDFTGEDVAPQRCRVWLYRLLARIFGLTFSLKLMERGEENAQANYGELAQIITAAHAVADDENVHENELLRMIDEERLRYLGAIVRGLNEALVELAGAITGLTLAFGDRSFVATAGIITGLATSLSLAGTEYLAIKSEDTHHSPVKGALYTGLANLLTVLLLLSPYLIFSNIWLALAIMLGLVVLVILLFSFYISVAREISFRRRFLEMLTITLGVAAATFAIGIVAREFLHIDLH